MAVETQDSPAPAQVRLWNDPRARAIGTQILVVVLFFGSVFYLGSNLAANLSNRGIASGFGFLSNPAGFDVAMSLIPYSPETSTHGDVFLVGLLNTLLIAAFGIVFATIVGFAIGILRLSQNWLIRVLAGAYIETVRNVPLLLQILFWYFGVILGLPLVRQATSIFDVIFISNRGVNLPWPVLQPGFAPVFVALLAAVAGVVFLVRWSRRRQEATGARFPTFWASVGILTAVPLAAFVVMGFPLTWDVPALTGFNYTGGLTIPSQMIALWLALVIYTGAFIAEIVRSGILAVSQGQIEAAHSLGLRNGPTLRLVVIPQAMRVIVPPLTSQYLNLMKNSSLAVAIGYPDLVAVFAGTSLNQTGQAVEIIAMTMAVYLIISLFISGSMNWYNRRIALVER